MNVLALAQPKVQMQLEHCLAPIGARLTFIRKVSDLPVISRTDRSFAVAILPATLPGADLWTVWGQVRLLHPRPEVLIYARTANFQLWSGVLEAGGRDVLIQPFSPEELQEAVTEAALAFEERQFLGTCDEPL